MTANIRHKGIMLQGTASTVGKSILCTAFCRIFTEDGYTVNPFKAQNMSLNSYITPEGLEMGRAQVMQAEAARQIPSVRMNPILLKPTSDRISQVVLHGKVHANLDAVDYFNYKPLLKRQIQEAYQELAAASDIVVIEGAGSPAEINLNRDDFVNMGMAELANAPVILVGDIDRGGVFAALYGTIMLLSEAERRRIKGVVINKFRGSYELLEPGIKLLEEKIGRPVLGVVPFFELNLEDEDSVTDWRKFGNRPDADLDIVVIQLPYMSNFTDFNAFKLYADVNLRFVGRPADLGQPDLIIIPGSKSSIADLGFLERSGLADRIKAEYRRGAFIFGICGGYQMLGMEIRDREAVETRLGQAVGLQLLAVTTEFQATKTTSVSQGEVYATGLPLQGYEIHMGETQPLDAAALQPFARLRRSNHGASQLLDGAVSPDQRVYGTYLHGVFDNSGFTRYFLNRLREAKGLTAVSATPPDYWHYKDRQYDRLAAIVRRHISMEQVYQIIEES